MSKAKKQVRQSFRDSVFERDGYRCVGCGFTSSPEKSEEEIDSHHITDRTLLPAGGYVKQNGVTLCKIGENCHLKAEQFHITGKALPGFSPEDLYRKIGSSHQMALEASKRLEKTIGNG